MIAPDERARQVHLVLSLLSTHARRPLADDEATRRLGFAEIGVSSLALAALVVELEDRLDRPFDFEAFAGVQRVGDLLRAVGLE